MSPTVKILGTKVCDLETWRVSRFVVEMRGKVEAL